MLLSSLYRLRAYCAGESENPITDNVNNNRVLLNWLSAVSSQVEEFLSRGIQIKERIEYKDIIYGVNEFWIDSPPVIELSTVSYDTSGLWDGSGESEITDPYIGSNNDSIVLGTDLGIQIKKGIQIVYTGGMAYHAVNSTFNMAASRTWTTGRYVKGSSSGAVGQIVSSSSLQLVLQNLYGVFEADETITEYTDEDCTTATSPAVSTTISSISKQSLAEAYPAIVTAVEAQVRFYWNHMTNFENTGTDKEGNTIRIKTRHTRNYPFLDEVYDLLSPYRKAY